MKRQHQDGLAEVIARHDVTKAQIVEKIGVTGQAVSLWITGKRQPSVATARLIHQIFNIPLHELRPDVWQPPSLRRRKTAA